MDQTQHTDDLRPLAGSDAASAPARSGFTLRGRDWVYAATLAPGQRGLIGAWIPGTDSSPWHG